jgi:hypothetical protein
MNTVSLRLPKSIHERVRTLSKQDGVSINQFITIALTEKLSVMSAEEYFNNRAKKGSQQRFEEIMSRVPDRKPLAFDALPKG